MQTKRQKQEKALARLEQEYRKEETIREQGGYYVGNIFYMPTETGRQFRIGMEIQTLKRKLGIRQ